jgi:arylsulfatase
MGKTNLLIPASILMITSCGVQSQKEQTKQKPNIIYILADDLGYGQLGCYGQEKIETPRLDALAAKGMIFTQHYAGAPLCAPSRCVLLTGKHLGHAQIRNNDEWNERGDVWDYVKTQEDPGLEGQLPLDAGTETIASCLRKAGYTTGMVGKWGLGGPATEAIPNRLGFDFFFGFNCQRQAWNYYPRYLWKDTAKVWLNNSLLVPGVKGRITSLPDGADLLDEKSYSGFSLEEYAPDVMQGEALRFIYENRERPFFLYYATTIPHTALQAPKDLVDYYHEKFGDEKPYLGEKNYFPARYPHATFAAMVTHLDRQIGELTDELRRLGLIENTLIIFTSDNGPANAGGTDSPWFESAKPFLCGPGRGKGTLMEGGIRVPMIACWPGMIREGSKSDHLSAFYDVLPTLCELTGAELPQNTDGISFLPELLSGKEQKKHAFLYWEFPGAGGQQAVRMGNWKGIRTGVLGDSLRIKLYNLEEDFSESNDLSEQHPEIVSRMKEVFDREHVAPGYRQFGMKALGD